MRWHCWKVVGLAALLASAPALGADYTVSAASGGPAEDQFSAGILKQIGSQGIKVARGKRTLLEFWPASEWVVKSDFKPSAEVLYPFELGQLVGVAQYKSKATDFRGQEIKPGAYTVRYGQQPVDGNHVGTAPTRDFFLLLPAGEDQDPVVLEKETLFKESADAAESSHPAILYMQAASSSPGELSIEHDEQHDWWIVSLANAAKAGDNKSQLPVKLIVVGQGQE